MQKLSIAMNLGIITRKKIYKPDMIHTTQESDHTNGLLEQYIQNIALLHLTQCAYQLPTMFFSETNFKLY